MTSVKRLIERFVPEHYDLFLDISRESKSFSGRVIFTGEAKAERISLHQKDLTIAAVRLAETELKFTMDDANEALHIDLGKTGAVELTLEFSGRITDNMTGIYPSYYTVDGLKKEVISTQFESHFAREAFPSVDEPEAKATFDFSVKFDQEEDEIALSNMPEIKSDERKKTGVWTFDTTPRMSSYLLAFALGDLHGKTAHTKNGTLVGSYATKAHQLSELDFSLDIAVRVIEFYEDYFGVRYPIPQCLHVGLPDFSAGAMENWGLVTYREVYLLVDENSTVSSRQQVALVIAHEVAHQWFGNLVTMKWWDDLWLNESFANMMEYVAIDAIEPSWNILEHFQTSGIQAALKRDATDGVQSVHVEVHHPDEINTLFDAAIVYAKVSRLMHMLRRWLGDEDFRKGLKIYFERHQYGNTVGRDLWNALSQASGRDVAGFMDSWLEQPGYPLVTATVENDQLILTQEQFFIGQNDPKGRLWQVPLNSNWTGLPDTLTEEKLVIPNFSQLASQNSEALQLNTDNTAHYLTAYEGHLMDELLTSWENLDKISKLQVLQERRFLAESGVISYSELLPLVANLTDEQDSAVLGAISLVLGGLQRFTDEGTPEEKEFKELVAHIFAKNYDRLGFEKKDGESDEDELVRGFAVGYMLYADHESAVERAKEIFQQYKDNIAAIPAAIRADVLINQVKHAESKELTDLLLQAYIDTNDGIFQRQLVAALAETKEESVLTTLVAAFENKDIIKPQDLSLWYSNFLRKPFSQEMVWTWARDDWDWIKAALGGDMSFDSFVVIPAAIFKTEERLAEYKAFFEPQLTDMALSRNIEMGIKDIQARIDLVAKDKEAVLSALKNSVK
ncbi:aminopeptidase [Streptococcus sp. X16XC17]|uniref:M1 family metallopeptidase n=1 Tax=unclassified Streptococcus TaxID=2608887 RepID=UPI00066FE68B|nr:MULTISPECIES: M1 family metallopeptidase [unclassified Streptococcus]TCD46283.1 aminopeptidase [Streptococcus sp. X16XC17]